MTRASCHHKAQLERDDDRSPGSILSIAYRQTPRRNGERRLLINYPIRPPHCGGVLSDAQQYHAASRHCCISSGVSEL